MKGGSMKKIALAAATAIGVLAVAAPASAKGISAAKITGPALPSGGITVSGPDAEAFFDAGLLQELKDAPPWKAGVPRRALGPRYRVVYRFANIPGASRARVHQDLYPYAKGGVWSYTPAGQTAGAIGQISPGWWASPDYFFDALVKVGMPAKSPIARSQATGTKEAAGGGSPMWLWPVLGAVILAGLGLALTRVRSTQGVRAPVR
jgi:hypothetical protein